TLALCSATAASALWTRTKGNNALVLREREEALRDEEEQQRRLAASVERDRIGNAIQHEVTSTLQAVRRKAVDGLDNLDMITDTSQKEVAQHVQDSFAAIGKEGRLALAHMRRLLRILRESKSDAGGETTSGTPQDGMDLAPAPTLEEQLKHLAQVTSSDSGTR
ncbi:MAG: sensor histidine kinase, partial [Bifidobacterium crudilactis]|nr:sensor histidine kinase [Bifidobacterium crudilactis]